MTLPFDYRICKFIDVPTVIIGPSEERIGVVDKLVNGANVRIHEIDDIDQLAPIYEKQVESSARYNSSIGELMPEMWAKYDEMYKKDELNVRANNASYKALLSRCTNEFIARGIKFNMDVNIQYDLCLAVRNKHARQHAVFVFDINPYELAEDETFRALYRAKNIHSSIFVMTDDYYDHLPDFIYQNTDSVVMTKSADLNSYIEDHTTGFHERAYMTWKSSGGRPLLFYNDYERVYVL